MIRDNVSVDCRVWVLSDNPQFNSMALHRAAIGLFGSLAMTVAGATERILLPSLQAAFSTKGTSQMVNGVPVEVLFPRNGLYPRYM